MSVHSADSPRPFLFTSTSLLLNNALITDEQQVTGKDGEQWINCTIRGDHGPPQIYYEANQKLIGSSPSGSNTAKSVLNSYTRNGLYYCFRQATKTYCSVYLKNSSKRVDTVALTRANTLTLYYTDICRIDLLLPIKCKSFLL